MAEKPSYEELEQRVKELENETFENKRAEEHLKRENTRAEECLTVAGVMLAIVNADENITMMNKKGCQILGYNDGELIGKNWFDVLVPSSVREEVRGVFGQLMAGNVEPVEYCENPLLTKDGEERLVFFHNALLRDQNGQIIGALTSGEDVTEHKQAEEALRESEAKYRRVSDNSPAVLYQFLMAPGGGVSFPYVSDVIMATMGVTPEEVMKDPSKLLGMLHPDDQKMFQEGIMKSAESLESFPLTFRCMKDGEVIWIEARGMPTPLADGGILWDGFLLDITERKQAEEALQRRTYDLDERVKELHCLYGISTLVEKPDISLEEIFRGFVDLISPSWQYPEITCARILLEDKEYKTENFEETNWKQSNDIVVHGKRAGVLEICYLEERPEIDDGPFLKEERELINAITERLGRIIERKQAEEALRKSERKYKYLQDASIDGHAWTDMEGYVIEVNDSYKNMMGYNEDELRKLNYDDLTPEKWHASEHKIVTEQVLVKGYSDLYEKELIRKDGTIIPVELRVYLIKDAQGNNNGMRATVKDISDRKRAEETLKTREHAIQSSINGINFTDLQGNFIYANNSFLKMWDFKTQDDLIGRNISDLWVDQNRYQETFSEFQKKGSYMGELEAKKQDGTKFDVQISTHTVKSESGEPLFLMASFVDITERKQAEEALRESEERMRNLIEQSPVSIQILDLNGMTVQVNKAWEELWGASWEEFVKFEYNIFKDEQAIKLGIVSYLETAYSGETVSIPAKEYDAQVTSKIGNKRWVKSNVYPIKDASGNVLNVVIIQEDITKRKEAEEAVQEAYRIINRSATVAFLWRNAEGWPVEFVSENVKKLFGYTAEEFTMGKISYATTVHPEDLERVAEEVKTFSGEEGRKDFRHEPYRIVTKDGEIKWIDDMAFIRRDEKGDITHYEGIVMDVSKRMKAENERESLQAQLQQAQKMEAMGTLAGGIAHDFNNLLMSIQGRASIMLMNKESSHPDFRHLKGIEGNIESAADLTRQLLGFARGGKYEVRPTGLNEVVKKHSRMFGRTKKEITIRGKYKENLWSVEVDRGQIEQVLLNLYVNAWQSMPGGGDLYLETENLTLDETDVKPFGIEPGKYVKISVTDTGVGMDKATREKIFEPFFTTKEMGRGTGLGLASAYGIIKNHGGFINVYSEKGHGTTFNIYVPASEKEVVEEKAPAGDILRGTETVLFVDDEDMIIEVAEELFEQLGYKVLTARNGKEAIEIYEKNKEQIDIVLLDMIMPDMSGSDTYDRLKAIDPNIKVLLSSGYSINGQATEIMDRGCNGFIQKPFKMKELSQKLRETLDEK